MESLTNTIQAVPLNHYILLSAIYIFDRCNGRITAPQCYSDIYVG
jgi:hypothetical protein